MQRQKILLVFRDYNFRVDFQKFVKEHEHTMLHTTNYRDALDIMDRNPDLFAVVSHLVLPNLTKGLDLLISARKRFGNALLVLVSPEDNYSLQFLCGEYGIHYLIGNDGKDIRNIFKNDERFSRTLSLAA